MDDNDKNSTSFKHINLVPDYRAWQIIKQQSEKIQSILQRPNCDPLLRNIAKEDAFRHFRQSLSDVEKHIQRNSSQAVEHLNQERSHLLAKELKQQLNLTPNEIVMVLNQMPNHGSMVELMFAGKFNKEQTDLIVSLVQQFLPMPSQEPQEEMDQQTDNLNHQEPENQKQKLPIKNEEP